MRRVSLCALLVLSATLVVLACPAAPARAGSANVAALQVALRELGYSPGPVDGISSAWTRRALRSFQRRKRLTVDGIPGRQTRRALGRRGRPALGSRPLHRGRRGWDVAALQFLLSSRGYGPGGFDGRFGPNTSAAVRRFQRAAGLAADGVAGPSTLGALRNRQLQSAPGGPVRFLRPLGVPIGDGFGWVAGRRHTGIDFPADSGTPIGAAGRGVVAFAGWTSGGYGYLVVVKHRLGFESWYAHLSSIAAWQGQAVNGGSRIGYVGSTGWSTGPHLHFEVRHFGTPIDPIPRLLASTASRRQRHPAGLLVCRPNADARGTRDADPASARYGRCP
ncbi:MAG: peptidoglycan-binding protein [Actinomycetota bacterium]|nr:peptidoglycan-binding protein [Actinomycetota bacterium]